MYEYQNQILVTPKLALINLVLPNGSHDEIKILDKTPVVLCHAI